MIVIFCHVGSQGRGSAVVLEPFLYMVYAKGTQSSLFKTSFPPSPCNIMLSAIAHMLKRGNKYKPSDLLKVTFVFYFKQKLLCG